MTVRPRGAGAMASRIRAFDWATTPLGPIGQWPQSLLTTVDLMLSSRHAMQLAWGPARIVLYNDAYAPMLGDRHPGALGIALPEAWPDAWEQLGPLVERVFAGETVSFEDLPQAMPRLGHREDAWWSVSWSPVRDEAGAVAGLLNVTADANAKVRAEQALRASEQRLRNVLDGMGEAFGLMDRDLRIITQNAAALRLDGRPLEEIRGRTHAEVYPNASPELIRLYERALAEGLPVSLEHCYAWEGGAPKWLEMRAFPVPEGLAVFWRDVSARKAVEEALRASERRQTFLLKLSDELRQLEDPASIKTVANRLLGQHLGADRVVYEEPVEKDGKAYWLVEHIYHVPEHPLAEGLYPVEGFGRDSFVVLAGGTAVVHDVAGDTGIAPETQQVFRAIGVAAYVALPLVRAGRTVALFVLNQATPRVWKPDEVTLLRDVAERTWSMVERAKAAAALRDADRKKDEFIAVLAHELRNPLAPIRAAMGVLRASGIGQPALARCRDIIDRQVAQMARLLEDLLDVSRLSHGKLTLQRAPVRLRDVINDAVEVVSPLMKECKHQLAVDQVAASVVLDADAARLVQIVVNLLNNAAKYTNPRGQIALSVEAQSAAVQIRVRDNGIGLRPDARERIFELFSQADDVRHRAGGGLGIGLGLTKQLVELHGGTIAADSAGPGHGSTFTVTLPLRAQAPAEAGGAQGTGGDATEPVPQRRRVLIVDDNADSADTVTMLLDLLGCETRTVYDGAAALHEAAAFHPELVLLDLGMPGLDGTTVCERMRRERWGANIVIAAITGWGLDEDRRRTKQSGFDVHLVKPVDPEVLIRLVRDLPAGA